jgi:epoxide hydrolase-like predicted phosphatase
MTIKAVVFDLGGVLESTIETGLHAKWEARLQLEPGKLFEPLFSSGLALDATVGKVSEEEFVQKFSEVYGINQIQVQELRNDVWEQYQLNVELAEFFRKQRPRYKTAILSNAMPGARRRESEQFHFDEMTDLIIYSYEEHVAKPDQRIFEITCERLNVEPEEVIFLDDVEANVAAAREFGIHAILFQNTAQAIADIQACLQPS